jgi:hypothetical protein
MGLIRRTDIPPEVERTGGDDIDDEGLGSVLEGLGSVFAKDQDRGAR